MIAISMMIFIGSPPPASSGLIGISFTATVFPRRSVEAQVNLHGTESTGTKARFTHHHVADLLVVVARVQHGAM
jgi:hypothetical protein